MGAPLFSIVIANYNYGRFLEEALLSIINQSCQDFELIVVDGGSTDNSVDVILQYAHRIAWWCSEKDRGQSHALNKGFSRASGKYFTWLNADDVMIKGGLAAVARKINQYPQCEWFIGSCYWLNEELRVVRCFRAHRFSTIRARWGHLSGGGPSSLFSKDLWKRVGGLDETLYFLMDIDLWHRFYFVGRKKYIRTSSYVWGYRIHEGSKMSGSVVAPEITENQRNRLMAEAELINLFARYGKSRRFERIANWCSISLCDYLCTYLENLRKIGCAVSTLTSDLNKNEVPDGPT
jgi:glycosyltransferase involved in cell wall biosynthesis